MSGNSTIIDNLNAPYNTIVPQEWKPNKEDEKTKKKVGVRIKNGHFKNVQNRKSKKSFQKKHRTCHL